MYLEAPSPTRAAPQPTPQPPPPPPFSRPTWGWGGEGISATGQRPLILWSVQWIELLGWGGGGGGLEFHNNIVLVSLLAITPLGCQLAKYLAA